MDWPAVVAKLVRDGAITVVTGTEAGAQAIATTIQIDGDVTVRIMKPAILDDGSIDAKLLAEHEALLGEKLAAVAAAAAWARTAGAGAVKAAAVVVTVVSVAAIPAPDPFSLGSVPFDVLPIASSAVGPVLAAASRTIARALTPVVRAVAMPVVRHLLRRQLDRLQAEYEREREEQETREAAMMLEAVRPPEPVPCDPRARSEWLIARGSRRGGRWPRQSTTDANPHDGVP